MSYTAVQKDPLLDESTRPADRKKAIAGAVIFTVLLLLSVFWRFFSKLDPIPEPQGLIASFENIEIEEGGGGGAPETEVKEEPKTESSSSKAKEVETNDDIKSSTSVKSAKNNDSDAKVDGGLDFGNFKGDSKGDDKKAGGGGGDLGTAKGSGNGSGTGDGDLEGPGSRKCISNCRDCSVKDDWTEVGDAFISVTIDASGRVTSAKMADAKKYGTNANFYGKQIKIAEECAKQRVYEPTGKTSKQVAKISFRKR